MTVTGLIKTAARKAVKVFVSRGLSKQSGSEVSSLKTRRNGLGCVAENPAAFRTFLYSLDLLLRFCVKTKAEKQS